MVAPDQVFRDRRVAALAQAVADGNVAEAQRMVSSGVDAKAKGTKGFTLPHFALYAKTNGSAMLRLLLMVGADPVSKLENGNDVPHYAAARDNADPEFLAALLDAGVSPDFVGGEEKNSLLHSAVSGRNIPVLRLLLSRGANIDFNHPITGTALHTALLIPDYRIATILLEHGANPTLKNKQDPAIAPTIPKRTPAEMYCRFQSGKRQHASAQQLADFEEMKAAFARRGVPFPCAI